jgi:hypothetical protein
MNSHGDNPFSTIESAHDFVTLLTKAICEAQREIEAYAERDSGPEVSRRLDALRIALYSLGRLENHMRQSSRLLNDLRTLRRLLFSEREVKSNTTPSTLRNVKDEDAEKLEVQLTKDHLSV